MTSTAAPERAETIVIGGGQAGLSVGYHLSRRGVPFLILEANQRIGDSWRSRWDSLRLFTPARFDGLAGMPFPAPPHSFPTKDEMADYLESYAAKFELPIRTGVKVDKVSRQGDAFIVTAGDRRFEAKNIVVAMADFQKPRIPAFASELDPDIVQLHSSEYRNPGSFAKEEFSLLAPLLFRVVFHRVLTIKTPVGRKARPKALTRAAPLIRVKSRDLASAGVRRVPRVAGVRNGLPLLQDEQTLDVTNVIWCTGFRPGFSWIDLPILAESGGPAHDGGVVASEPGLYFVGLHFLYAFSSAMIHGVGRDAERIAATIAASEPTRFSPLDTEWATR